MKLFAKGAVAVAVALSLGVANAACNVDKWDDTSTGKAASVTDGASRYEGVCSLDGSTGVVEKSINGSTKTFFRFYVYVQEAQTDVTIFKATDGKNSAELKLNGDSAEFGDKTTKINVGKWNQIDLSLDAGATSLTVNKGTAVAGTTTLTGATTKISLGKVAGAPAGKLFFDAFIASNDTAIPADASVSLDAADRASILIPGDADGNGSIDPEDVVALKEEIFASIFGDFNNKDKYISGVPDRDLDGEVTPEDVSLVKQKIFDDIFNP